MRSRQILLWFFCLIIAPVAYAQYYDTGQDPGSLKWLQIKTGRFTVIYPKSYGQQGINFARSLDEAYTKLTTLYPDRKFKIPVIIHNYTIESNGYVAWAPSRMELYPTPEQNSIPLDPDTQLAIHELTHVLQMESLDRGFTRAMSFLLGQQFPGVVSSLLPLWFLEGDAVFSESVLTGSGRGRAPSFQKQLKAIALEKGRMYKYDKIVNGSFRNFVPDHYQSGFQMMAWSYAKYDSSLWKKALRYTANAPFTLNPVNFSLTANAGLTKKKLFRETFDTLNTLWKAADKESGSESFEELSPPKRGYINYYSPVIAGQDSIIAVKTSLSDVPSFVLINPSLRSEKRIYVPGNGHPWFISFAKGKLIWVETHNDPRWENRAWSVIMVRDLKKNSTRQLSVKTRYMSASISPDGNFIAAAENTIENKNNLVIIDSWNGNILRSIPSPGNAYLQRPQWDETGKNVTVISLTHQGEGIMCYKMTDKSWITLIEPDNNDLQSAFLRNDSLFFISSYLGTDNVWLLKPDKRVVPLTNSRFGVSDLNVRGYSLLFADYSSSGNNICHTTLPENVVIKPAASSYLISRFKPVPDQPEVVSDQIYNPRPYRKWQHLFRFHSWMPFYADLEAVKSDPTAIRPGFTLATQNNLSTLISTIGYEYSDNRHMFHTGIKWAGWYLPLETRLDYGHKPAVEKLGPPESVPDPDVIKAGYDLANTISLPLYFRGGRFSQNLYLSATSKIQNNYIYLREKGAYDNLQNQVTGRIYISNFSRQAVRDIYPEWGQVLDVSRSFYPSDKELFGHVTTVRSAFYFPGILKDQGIRLRIEAEKQAPEKFILDNRTSFSRGYIGARTLNDDPYYVDIIPLELQYGSMDYFLPVVYPDFNLGSILYLPRIRADFFYDITRGTDNYVFISRLDSLGYRVETTEHHNYTEKFTSFGIELVSDFYLFRLPFMISSGIQASWRRLDEMPYFKLLFNIDLFGMSIGRRKI